MEYFIGKKMTQQKKDILIQIDTFITNELSIEMTKKCLTQCRKLELPILLTSHSGIPKELIDLSDYCEFDTKNVSLEKTGSLSYLYWISEEKEIRVMLEDTDSHAPACLTSLIDGAKFAKENGYKHFLRIEYDTIIKDSYIKKIKNLIDLAKETNGLILSSFREWVDGNFLLFDASVYLDCFDCEIENSQDYIRFVSSKGIESKNHRHLQVVQFQIMNVCGVLQNVISIPTSCFEKMLDKSLKKIDLRELGIFRPGNVLNSGGEKFAIIAYGFSMNQVFSYKILHNGVLFGTFEQSFLENNVTYRIFEMIPETKYTVIYTNPITNFEEKWEFCSSEELEKFAKLTFK